MGVFTYVGLPAMLSRLEAAGLAVVNEGANHLVGEAQSAAPNRTGQLAAGIHTDGAHLSGAGVEAVVSTGAESSEYAVPQHEGAGPHVIRAKNAKALAWPGGDHPVKQVNHPGNPATKFLEDPLMQMTAQYVVMAQAAMRAAF